MHRDAKVITVVLIALVASLTISVSAQKAKPAKPQVSYWTVKVQAATDPNASTIAAGLYDGDDFFYDPSESPEVSVSVNPLDSTNPWNQFQLKVENADPYAAKTTTAPWRWIRFRNVGLTAGTLAMGPYSQQADQLGPVPEGSGYFWPFELEGGVPEAGEPSYQVKFMNDGAHPRQFYEAVVLYVAFQGASLLDMAQGVPEPVDAKSAVAIWSKRDCGDPNDAGIGLAIDRAADAEPLQVTRTGPDEWTLEVNQAVELLEFGYAPQLSKRRTACVMGLHGGWWTTPLRYTLILRRVAG